MLKYPTFILIRDILKLTPTAHGSFNSKFNFNRPIYSQILVAIKNFVMGKENFYAVKRGRRVGIYKTWNECKQQVDGFSNPRYKKFSTESEALEFINTSSPTRSNSTNPKNVVTEFQPLGIPKTEMKFTGWKKEKPEATGTEFLPLETTKTEETFSGSKNDKTEGFHRGLKRPANEERQSKRRKYADTSNNYDPKFLSVYTDGACEKNGRNNAIAGIGVFWGPEHPMNVSERLEGRATNNRAEIHAAIKAIEQAKSMGLSAINLHTDSKFLITSVTEWMPKWRRNNWKKSLGDPVINKEDFEELITAMVGIKVNWVHVRGHAGFAGNEAADKLAKEGCHKK